MLCSLPLHHSSEAYELALVETTYSCMRYSIPNSVASVSSDIRQRERAGKTWGVCGVNLPKTNGRQPIRRLASCPSLHSASGKILMDAQMNMPTPLAPRNTTESIAGVSSRAVFTRRERAERQNAGRTRQEYDRTD